MGENPALTDPDSDHAIKAMQQLDLLVVQDIFLTETGKLADVVLPASSFAEKDGTFSNTERRVARVRQAIPPVGQSRPDWKIICEISNRLGYPMNYGSPEEVFEEIRKVTPAYAGISYKRLEAGGLQWPCPNEEHPGTVYLHKDRFAKGLGTFFAIDHKDPAEMPDAEYPALSHHRPAPVSISFRHHEPAGPRPGGKSARVPGGAGRRGCRQLWHRRRRPGAASAPAAARSPPRPTSPPRPHPAPSSCRSISPRPRPIN